MFETLVSAALACGAALLIGQGVLRLCGWRQWSWLSAPVGLSAMMLLSVPALHAPGRSTTTGIVVAACAVAGAAAMVREPALRPPIAGLVAALPTMALTLVPFAVAGRSGILGVSTNNDMAAHLLMADAHRSAALTAQVGPSYPLGPHATAASIADLFGMTLEYAFTGLTMAGPVLLAWTALGSLRRSGPVGQVAVATFTGIPFLVAGYFGQGSFKELFLAALVLGFAVALTRWGEQRGIGRWVPAGVMTAGMVSVYSYTGLLWPAAFLAGWALVLLAKEPARGGRWRGRVTDALRAEWWPLAAGAAVTLVVMVPQAPRVVRYLDATGGGTGVPQESFGNLFGRLRLWEAFGIWDSADYRVAAHDGLATGVWAGLVLILAVHGAVRLVRAGDWMLPLAGALCVAIWLYADRTQSPYVAAKALVVLAPFVMLIAVRPIVDRAAWPVRPPPWWGVAAPLVLVVLAFKALGSTWDALRVAQVGPRDHLLELRDLRASTDGRPTLFLGNDDFVRYALRGVPVVAPFIGGPHEPTRPEKAWHEGQALDVDSVAPATYARVDWVITTRDAIGSAVPGALRLVRTTRDFALYRREGRMPDRQLLAEGEAPAAVLNCREDPQALALSRTGGIAGVRGAWVVAPVPERPARDRVAEVPLGPGTWDLVAAYSSPLPVRVTAPGMTPTTLPPKLDRTGPRFPIGRVEVGRPTRLPVRLRVRDRLFSSSASPPAIPAIIANPVGTEREVPLRRACGRLVDFWLPEPPAAEPGRASGASR